MAGDDRGTAGAAKVPELAWLRRVVTGLALAMGVGELAGDKMKTAPDRTVFLGLLARVMSAGIAGAGPTEWENYNSWYSGRTIGIVPLADLVEEFVGNVRDETHRV